MVSIANGQINVKGWPERYDFRQDTAIELRALLVGALTDRMPVALTHNDGEGTVSRHEGIPITVTQERLSLRTGGGLFRCALWQIDRADVIACEVGA